MHFIRNNGKISQIQVEKSSSPALLTEDVLYENPVSANQLEFKIWEAFQVLAGSNEEGISQKPTLTILNHNYINDWEDAVKFVVPDVLPDYPDSTTARSAGLTDGMLYRTGDFVKQLYSLV